jgi:hypothetical protein
MKRRLILFLVAAVVLFSVNFCNAEGPKRDGNWWQTFPESAKVFYVAGLQDGLLIGHGFSDPLSPCAEQELKTFQEQIKKYSANVSVKQIVDGLDRFYSDYRNRGIRIHFAVAIVMLSIAGEPQKGIDEKTEQARQEAARED